MNEITLSYQLSVINGDFRDQFQPSQQRYDQSAQGYHSGIASVGTSEEALSLGDVSTAGIAVFQNLDSTNYVTLGPDSAGSMVPAIRLNPGEVIHFRMDQSASYKWQADTATCKVLFKIYEN